NRLWARDRPRTVPGTPTTLCPYWSTPLTNMSAVAAAGAVSRYSMTVGLPLGGWMSMNPPPPMLPATGYVTASAKATATAASTALPPDLRTDTPTSAAGGDAQTTMPCRASTAREGSAA